MTCRHLTLAMLVLAILCPAALAGTIWVEGEEASASSMAGHPWYDQVKTAELSGGDWISHWKDGAEGIANYRVNAPEAGEYHFWLRANPTATGLSWRLNMSEWSEVGMSGATDRINVAADDEVDLRFLAWVELGTVELRQGANTLTFRAHSENNNHGAIDCFTFTTDAAFTPEGTSRPAGASPAPAAGSPAGAIPEQDFSSVSTWAFTPDVDRYSPNSMLDLRSLNEEYAGEHGFIGVSPEGDFVRGDGQPMRFWAVNTGAWTTDVEGLLADHARFLAKRGVNMVRWHGNITPKGENSAITDFDAGARDKLWRYVAAMKKEGIYMTISPYWANSAKPRRSWGVPREGTDMHALLFFDPVLQAAYKQWLRAIYEPVNPYTGIALKDDPAVAIIQIQNEDSLLFWTVNNLKGENLDLICRQYGNWLTRKYGSLQAASHAWQGAEVNGDDLGRGLPRFYNIWELTEGGIGQLGRPTGGRAQRIADQVEFWTETMYRFNEEIVRFLRQDIGARQLVNPGNWKTADPVLLEDAERYSYTAGEVIAVNRYVGDTHIGENNGWAIVNGDRFQDRSVLVRPQGLAVSLKQVAGRPMIITESNWVLPRAYQSEGPFLVSVFQSLNGVDAFYWFAFGGAVQRRPRWGNPTPQWRQPSSANGYLPSLMKWAADTPEILGNFPAAALIYRLGYVQRGETVVHERRKLEDMWQLRVPIISETGSYDPNRDRGDYAPESNIKQEVNRLAFLVGPVEVTYGADPANSQVADLSRYIDEGAQVVRSITSQVQWDYARGICMLSAPKAQGVTGFLAPAGPIDLGDVTVTSGNDYATVVVVAMDDRPLASSERILVQTGTISRPTGWQQRPTTWTDDQGRTHEGYEVVNYGRAPWRIISNDMTISVRNGGLTQGTALDMNGMPRGQVGFERDGDVLTFRMPADAKYVILHR